MTWIIAVFFIIAGIISAVTGIPFWVPVVAGLALIFIGYVSVVYYKVFTRRGIIRTRAFVMAELRRKRLDREKRIADACEESRRNHRKYLRESNRKRRHPRKRPRFRNDSDDSSVAAAVGYDFFFTHHNNSDCGCDEGGDCGDVGHC